jgi:hypothetical protein
MNFLYFGYKKNLTWTKNFVSFLHFAILMSIKFCFNFLFVDFYVLMAGFKDLKRKTCFSIILDSPLIRNGQFGFTSIKNHQKYFF